jgi:GNAT superfamily N-acetyltransferase
MCAYYCHYTAPVMRQKQLPLVKREVFGLTRSNMESGLTTFADEWPGEPMSFKIRPLEPDDKNDWHALWLGYLEHYQTTLPQDVTEHLWQRVTAEHNEPEIFGIAAVDDETGELLGICHYFFHASTWSRADYCYLEDLFTSSASRGRGVGRALIAAVVAEATKRDSPKIYWQTHETNAVAQVLYNQVANRTGFMVYDINPTFGEVH